MKNNNFLKNILLLILLWFGILILNNASFFKDFIGNERSTFNFITFEIIFSMIIALFYIFVVRKKNKYIDIAFYIIFFFFNLFNGIDFTHNVDTFFLLYIFIITFAFVLFKKIDNFSFSLITSFSIILLVTLLLGIFNLLPFVKYLLPICFLISLIYIYIDRKNYVRLVDSFFNKELIIFTILFIIAILGGIGRYVHIYDEYSHWAYDAKAVIYYDKLSTAQEIMSKTRSYAPIITCWHYIVAQYASFNEPNLYIGLAIFCSVYIMALFCNIYKKNNLFLLLALIVGYSAVYYFGGVYNYGSLYADLAFSLTFSALLISYFYYKDCDKKNIPLLLILPIVTLIKPSGCVVVFAFMIFMLFDYILKNKTAVKASISSFIKSILAFIKKYWFYILAIAIAYLFWNIYIKIINSVNTEFYTYEVRPWTLFADLQYKLNLDFLLAFAYSTIQSLDGDLIYSIINLSYFKFLILIFIALIFARLAVNKNDFNKTKKEIISLFISYFIFFFLTILSVFVMLSYYEAKSFSSGGRYLNVMNVALVYLCLYFIFSKNFIISKKREVIAMVICCLMIVGLSFNQICYFGTDILDRMGTKQIYYERTDKFQVVVDNTDKTDNVYVIDQQDTDGIMAMWYARYYLFPRNVNSSSTAISWKIKTEANKDDLQDWGMTAADLEDCLIKYNFNYLFLYTVDNNFYEVASDMFDNVDNAKKYSLFKVTVVENDVKLIPVK